MPKCKACKHYIPLQTGSSCTMCSGWYHRHCVGLNMTGSVPLDWICPWCYIQKPRQAARRAQAAEGAASSAGASSSCEAIPMDEACALSIKAAIKTTLKSIKNCQCAIPVVTPRCELSYELEESRQEMRDMKEDIIKFRQDVMEVKQDANDTNKRIVELAKIIDSFEKRLRELEINAVQVYELQLTVITLRQELNDKEQELLGTDIEISGVPEQRNEGLLELIRQIGKMINCPIEEMDIVFARRFGSKRILPNGMISPRPRPLVVRFSREIVKDRMVRAARVHRSAHIMLIPGIEQPATIYINERLTNENKLLFARARDLAKRNQWRYVWTKQGKLFMRQANGTAVHKIRFEADVCRIIREAIDSNKDSDDEGQLYMETLSSEEEQNGEDREHDDVDNDDNDDEGKKEEDKDENEKDEKDKDQDEIDEDDDYEDI